MIKAAVLGYPISHSLSPLLHNLAYRELGIEGEYSQIEIKAGELEVFLSRCDRSWTGFSLTMPLKEEVLKSSSKISDLAKKIRSANTLLNSNQGWSATTTDTIGFKQALVSHDVLSINEVLVIGAGATARAAVAALDGMASHIFVMNRSKLREEAIRSSAAISNISFVSWDDMKIFETADLIISTTPEGASDVLTAAFPKNPKGVFFDVLYKPWPTAALATWESLGGRVIDGLDLLIHQGIEQVSLFSGQEFDRVSMASLMRSSGVKELNSST